MAWQEESRFLKPDFNPKAHERKVTVWLKDAIDKVYSQQAGLFGHWLAEAVDADRRPDGKLSKERRADLRYAWNDDGQQLRLLLTFEFKLLSRLRRSRTEYIRNGMARYITGAHERGSSLVVMAGILNDKYEKCVIPLKNELQTKAIADELRSQRNAKLGYITEPSLAFPDIVEFDTAHQRNAEAEPPQMMVLAHLFLPWSDPKAIAAGTARQRLRTPASKN